MNESRTPRTDANLKVLHPGVQPSTWYVQAEFARQLERDLTAALARAEKAEAELAAKVVNEQLLDTRSYVSGADVAMDECISNPVWLSNLLSHRTMIVRRLAHALIGAQAELERARKDAQRYRWLAEPQHYALIAELWMQWLVKGPDSLGKAIDAAIEEERKNG